LGAGLGGQAAAYGANAGRYTYAGGTGAAQTMQGANAYNPYATGLINASTNQQLQQGIGNLFGSPYVTPTSQLSNQIGQLGSGTGRTSDWYTGANGWGSYGE
jgi:hypothetical protein